MQFCLLMVTRFYIHILSTPINTAINWQGDSKVSLSTWDRNLFSTIQQFLSLPLFYVIIKKRTDSWNNLSNMSYLQKPCKFAITIRNMYTFFALFFITKCTDNITKCKKALVDVNSCLRT